MPDGGRIRILEFGIARPSSVGGGPSWDWTMPLRVGAPHTGTVRSVATAVVGDRTLIITASGDDTVRRWDAQTAHQSANPSPATPARSSR
jgi:hypothetical protein